MQCNIKGKILWICQIDVSNNVCRYLHSQINKGKKYLLMKHFYVWKILFIWNVLLWAYRLSGQNCDISSRDCNLAVQYRRCWLLIIQIIRHQLRTNPPPPPPRNFPPSREWSGVTLSLTFTSCFLLTKL